MNRTNLKILQCSPIDIEVSRRLKYAGTERIVDALNQVFHEKGHTSLVAASGDSDLSEYGTLVPTFPRSLWATSSNGLERKMVRSQEAYLKHFNTCLDYAIENGVDIIQDHPGQFLVSSSAYLSRGRDIRIPIVTTIHEIPSEDKRDKYKIWKKLKKEKLPVFFITLSNSHKMQYEREADFVPDGFIYNGIPLENFPFEQEKQDYMFWIGRLSDIKGTDLAIQVALKNKRPLIIAGEIHTPFKQFCREKVNPFLTKRLEGTYEEQERQRNHLVEILKNNKTIVQEEEIFYVGPLDDRQKSAFYQRAHSVLVPNRWQEPFGLIMIEGMATGTPVVGTDLGAIPEIIKNGKTGYVVETSLKKGVDKRELDEESIVRGLVDVVDKVEKINPQNCRQHVENNFSKEIMGKNYIDFYKKVLNLS